MQRSEVPLLYNFIKAEAADSSVAVSEAALAGLSGDISYKVHRIALLAKSIMLKSQRNFLTDEDVISALKLSFKNLLLVSFIDEQEERLISPNKEEIIINVSSHSVSLSNTFNNFNLRSGSDIVFAKLLKTLLSNKKDIFKNSLRLIRSKSDIDDIIVLLLSAFNAKIDGVYNEKLLIRVCLILEAVVNNTCVSMSENPCRDLCISLLLKLLWSPLCLNFKIVNVANVLNCLLSRQFFLKSVIRNMLIETFLKDLEMLHVDPSRHSGSIVGLIRLDYVNPGTIEHLITQISLFPSASNTTLKEAVSFLFNIMKIKKLCFCVPYAKLFYIISTFFCSESVTYFFGQICNYKMFIFECPILRTLVDPLDVISHITSFETTSTEIEILLHGGSIDNIMSTSEEIDDLPPVLFRKSHIQLPISNCIYSTQDIGFKNQFKRSVNFTFKISGVDNTLVDNNHGNYQKLFVSNFHAAFQRRRQFIENRYRLKIKTDDALKNKNCMRGGCMMYSLLYAI